MKDEINLLPPSLVVARRRQIYYQRLVALGYHLAFNLALIATTLAVVWWVEARELKLLRQQAASTSQISPSLQASVAGANQLLSEFSNRVHQHPAWLPAVGQLIETLPPEIQLTGLIVESGAPALKVQAVSASRTAALAWQRSLEQLPWVDHVDAPLQNFASGPDGTISFTLWRSGTP